MKQRTVGVSKLLTRLLRHDATREAGVTMDRGGYVPVSEVLGLEQFKKVTLAELLFVVENNSKKRFELSGEGDALRVRAVQGHSMHVAERIDHATLLTLITPDHVPSACVHGTYAQAWESIKREEGQAEISAFRASCDVMIHIDVAGAMAAGLKFFRSRNNVILTEGLGGILQPAFFAKAEILKSDRPPRQ